MIYRSPLLSMSSFTIWSQFRAFQVRPRIFAEHRTRFRESSNSRSRRDAETFLRQRLEAAAQGKPVGPRAGETTFEDLAKILLDDYRANGRRSVERVEDAVGHLRQFFAETRASQITGDLIARYVRLRQEDRAAPATINRELGALRRAFRLAQSAGKVASRPDISMLAEGNRREDFFEADEFRAVLENLPEYLRPVIHTAYVTGWRINSEILTRQKRHVDLDSGCLRLEPTETIDGRGRSFPLTTELREALTRQLEKTADLEGGSGRVVPWLFHRDGKPIKDFRKAWALACRRAGVAGKVPDDFRRTAVRNLERAGVPRSAAMTIVGHRSESIYRGIAMADDMTLKHSATKLDAFHRQRRPARIRTVTLQTRSLTRSEAVGEEIHHKLIYVHDPVHPKASETSPYRRTEVRSVSDHDLG